MDDHDMNPTCLSAEPHKTPRDPVLHYFGCLEFCKRETYFESLPANEQSQIESNLRGTKILLSEVSEDRNVRVLVDNIQKSIEAWRGCVDFQNGIQEVKHWSGRSANYDAQNLTQREPKSIELARSAGSPQSPTPSLPASPIGANLRPDSYDPDHDTNAYIVQYHNYQAVDNLEHLGIDPRYKFPNHKIPICNLLTRQMDKSPLRKAKQQMEQPGQPGQPPEQQPGQQPEHQAQQGQEGQEGQEDLWINYFHLPLNNMDWVERAISRYFGEETFEYNDIYKEPSDKNRTAAYMMLRPEYWQGQQHGGKSAAVHARHLRPLCETISADPKHVETSPRNIALFMPYLHWETDRMREKISRFIDDGTVHHHKSIHETEWQQKLVRQKDRGGLTIPALNKKGQEVKWPDPKKYEGPKRTGSAQLHATAIWIFPKIHKHFKSKIFDQKQGRIIAGTKVGQVLFDAAMLYEAMSTYRDKKVIEKYLHHDPPLHPRRTLDQAYYWTLKTTKTRDRDQVVYRGTRPNPAYVHKIDKDTRKWNCKGMSDEKSTPRNKHKLQSNPTEQPQRVDNITSDDRINRPPSETDSLIKDIGDRCADCRRNIRKVSRVIMVDQLWMWILDERTIITAFPKRYGANKQDHSGVHKAIRTRLKGLRSNHIRTVFDLALIILDECSNVFFDRTKTREPQPQVLDIFSEAIGSIANKQVIGFRNLWECTQELAKLADKGVRESADLNHSVTPMLNVSTEGELQREIRDIIDEIDIMTYIGNQQKEVMKKFKKDVERLLDEGNKWKDTAPVSSSEKTTGSVSAKRHEDYKWFVVNAEELLLDVQDRIDELTGLRKSAESTSAGLDDLLSLKQQQAALIQAWQSVQQADEAVKQGRSIMVFTVITIIFLPLAFIASIFGMNNQQISDSGAPMTLWFQFKLMFLISAGIIFVVLIFAYSPFVRALFWLTYRYLAIFFVTHTPLYDRVYLSHDDWKTASLTKKVEEKVRNLKGEVKVKNRERLAQKARNESEWSKKQAEKQLKARQRETRAENNTGRVSRFPDLSNGSPEHQRTVETMDVEAGGALSVDGSHQKSIKIFNQAWLSERFL